MAVLDVGSGWGDISSQITQMVGPNGRVVGMDCAETFLNEARKDAATAGLANVTFERGDAEIVLPVAEFDYVTARFGTMFFANPVAVIRRMRLALKSGGKMRHIVWRRRAEDPALRAAKHIALKHLPARIRCRNLWARTVFHAKPENNSWYDKERRL